MLTPQSLGLPYDSWRSVSSTQTQFDVVIDIIDSPNRVTVVSAPTGTGKTLINFACGVADNLRILYLVQTNALLSQVREKFSTLTSPMTGRGNYRCNDIVSPYTNCADGKCNLGQKCILKLDGCDYYDAERTARENSISVVSNFAYNGSLLRYGDRDSSIGIFDLLIIDEAHGLLPWLSDFVSVKLDNSVLSRYTGHSLPAIGDKTNDLHSWSHWALELSNDDYVISSLGQSKKAFKRRLYSELKSLGGISQSANWVIEKQYNRVSFTPIDPRQYLERFVYGGIKKIILSSATISQVESSDFDKSAVSFVVGGDGFHPSNRPIVSIPTSRISNSMSIGARNNWLLTIEKFVSVWIESYNGIIDTVSFRRGKMIYDYLIDNGIDKDRLILHRQGHKLDNYLAEFFKPSTKPRAIISPSIIEGYDLYDDLARWMLITKVPFVNPKSKLVIARKKLYSLLGRNYLVEMAAKGVIQRAGRIVRSHNDYGLTAVTDDSWYQYVSKSPVVGPHIKKSLSVCYDGIPKPEMFKRSENRNKI